MKYRIFFAAGLGSGLLMCSQYFFVFAIFHVAYFQHTIVMIININHI